MKANFDDQLKIAASGRKLEACGTLDWKDLGGPQNVNKVIVTVTITQAGVSAGGTSREFSNPIREWMIDLRPGPGQKFQPGPAEAKGTLTVADPPPDTRTSGTPAFSWDGKPNLVFGLSS
jgi:hypothetical protein